MNTNLLKKFAQAARIKLIEQLTAKLNFVLTHDTSEFRGKSDTIAKLKEEIKVIGQTAVIDKVAYTWFNRLVALRYMDANGYQPTGISILSPVDSTNSVSPQILDEAHAGNIPTELTVNKQLVMDILDGRQSTNNPDNEAYRLLLVAACNQLHTIFPFLFERIDDYTELLLPDDLTSPFSIITDVVNGMSTEDCSEVEIIGWLYQFYISEKKDEVFASKKAVKKEDIPAATQLFTPRWIVEYMVQNTVGKLWLQNRPNSRLRENMPYYIETPSSNTIDYLKLNSIEELRLLDQACGSGHILVYGFELLYHIYEEEGYNPSEIPQLIVEKNLYGFEIDERAAQLAGMAVMMKARSYSRRFFKKEVKPNIVCFNDLLLSTQEIKDTFHQIDYKLSDSLNYDLKNMQQASIYGSLIVPHTSTQNLESALSLIITKEKEADIFLKPQLEQLRIAIDQLVPLSQKYHCIVDNPPYMGSRKMDASLSKWLRVNYPQSYQDLFSCFVVRINNQLLNNGLASFVTLQVWMFVSSFSSFREWLLSTYSFNSLVQIGGNSFPSLNSQVARAVMFSFTNSPNNANNKSISFDLDSVENSHNVDKKELFEQYIITKIFNIRNFNLFKNVNRFTFLHSVTDVLLNVFIESIPFGDLAKPRQGLATGCNDRFVRYWHEVSIEDTYWENQFDAKWFPYNKGGDYRKWYGNNDNVVNWEFNGNEIKDFKDSNGKVRSRPQNESYYFKEGVTYSLIGNSDFCARSYEAGYIFDVGGSGFFPKIKDKNLLLGLVNSSVGSYLLSRLNPTVNFQVGDIGSIPIVKDIDSDIKTHIEYLVNECCDISKSEWIEHEVNSQFSKNEVVKIFDNLDIHETIDYCIQKRLVLLKKLYKNELQLDSYFSKLYKLSSILIKNSKKISLYNNLRISSESKVLSEKLNWENGLIIDLCSYIVGCMFGRYSLDKEGLILANQGETLQDYLQKVGESSFLPDEDNIIPVLDDEWFEDDIVARFYEFLKVSFGEKNFQKNLLFVEECLGKDVRKYFVKDFYKDHIQRYKKRPIYWMFSSPKGYFNVLVYLHRYTPDTMNRILNSYLKEFIEKLRQERKQQEHIQVTGTPAEQGKALKEIDKIDLMIADCHQYEVDILYPLAGERIALDLDDGVLVNYNKMGKAVLEVAGLNDKITKKKVKGFDWIDIKQIR